MSLPDQAHRRAMERDTLRLLCSTLIQPVTRVEFCRMLDSSSFVEPVLRTMFQEIRSMGPIGAKELRELLPGRVTSRGFPDFDIQELLAPNLVSEQELETIFHSAFRLMEIQPEEEPSATN